MKRQWIKEHPQFPVSVMCEQLGVSRSGFYATKTKIPSVRKTELSRLKLAEPIRRIHAESDRTYGSPRVTRELKKLGVRVSENTVAKCMKEHGIRVAKADSYVPRTTQSDPSLKASPNLLDRNFEATKMNEKWCSDITYVDTDEGWLYLATIKDLFSKRIVGWAMAGHMKAELTMGALMMAIKQRGNVEGVIHHSDRGKQYACGEYRALLEEQGIRQSMGAVGDCYDNAPAESFFASLKKELVNRRRFVTREQARHAIFEYIEVFYNRKRLHSALDYVSPVQFEARELVTHCP